MDTDVQLWDAFRAGDMEAFSRIYQRHYRELYNYGYTIFADKEQIKDCLHELFLDLWERRARLASVTSIKYYLLVSFRRRMLHELRGQVRLDYSLDPGHAEPEPSAEERFLEEEARFVFSNRFQAAFRQLPARRREAIYLRYYQQLSYAQITEVMNLQYQTVRDLISKGIKSLREQLRQAVVRL